MGINPYAAPKKAGAGPSKTGTLGSWMDANAQGFAPRMIISSQGDHREGKSQFALTAPGPIACFPFDNNTMELVRKWLPYKRILVPPDSLDYTLATQQEEWMPIWEKLESYWLDAVNSPSIRTIMADTGTEMYELCRLAMFGKLEQVPAHFYNKVYARFKRLIDLTYRTDKNVIFIHRQKDEYEKSGKKGEGVRTGRRILNGYNDVPFKVQVTLLHWRTSEEYDASTGIGVDEANGLLGFGFTVLTCTQRADLAGKYLAEPGNTWAALGSLAYPETDEAYWDVSGY